MIPNKIPVVKITHVLSRIVVLVHGKDASVNRIPVVQLLEITCIQG